MRLLSALAATALFLATPLFSSRGEETPTAKAAEKAKFVIGAVVTPDGSPVEGADGKLINNYDAVRLWQPEICLASGQQNTLRSDDPQIRMLEKVGHANLNLLIENLSTWPPASFYVQAAIKSLVQPEDRDLIIANLSKSPRLIEIIQEKSWAAAAKDEIWKTIQKKPDWIPNGFILALASQSDPATYEDLATWYKSAGDKIRFDGGRQRFVAE